MSLRERFRRLLVGSYAHALGAEQPAPRKEECPLPDCSSCVPSVPPLDVAAELERSREIAYVASWLVEHYPEVWYFEDAANLLSFAAGILEMKRRAEVPS